MNKTINIFYTEPKNDMKFLPLSFLSDTTLRMNFPQKFQNQF